MLSNDIPWEAGARCPCCGGEPIIRSIPVKRLGEIFVRQALGCREGHIWTRSTPRPLRSKAA